MQVLRDEAARSRTRSDIAADLPRSLHYTLAIRTDKIRIMLAMLMKLRCNEVNELLLLVGWLWVSTLDHKLTPVFSVLR